MKNTYTTIKQVQKRINIMSNVEIYKPITIIRKIFGYGLIYYGIITLPLPAGSIFAIMAGCSLVSIDYKELLKSIKFYVTKAYNTLYGLRSFKLIKYNIKLLIIKLHNE